MLNAILPIYNTPECQMIRDIKDEQAEVRIMVEGVNNKSTMVYLNKKQTGV